MEAVKNAIARRIINRHLSLLMQHGPGQVTDAVDAVAAEVGDVEEIGTSDVSAWVRRVEQVLGGAA